MYTYLSLKGGREGGTGEERKKKGSEGKKKKGKLREETEVEGGKETTEEGME